MIQNLRAEMKIILVLSVIQNLTHRHTKQLFILIAIKSMTQLFYREILAVFPRASYRNTSRSSGYKINMNGLPLCVRQGEIRRRNPPLGA